jgi:hypothetical protein
MGLCKTNNAKSDDRLFETQNEEMLLRLISRCSQSGMARIAMQSGE